MDENGNVYLVEADGNGEDDDDYGDDIDDEEFL